jgi:uncharacterized protein (TIGR02217 family)
MSNALFPATRGLTWSVTRRPCFNTVQAKSASLKRAAAQLAQYPIWDVTLTYSYLKNNPQDIPDPSNNPFTDLDTVLGFFLQRGGSFDDFLLNLSDLTADERDSKASGEIIGIGDGVATQFQLVRNIGGFKDIVQNIAGVPEIQVNGNELVITTDFSVSATGMVTFVVAPAAAAVITANFLHLMRVHFVEDALDFENFMYQLYTLQQVELETVKL